MWATALYDEVVVLGYQGSYPSFTRALRTRQLRPRCEACAGTGSVRRAVRSGKGPSMVDDLLHPDDRPDPAARFRTDLAGYLRGLPGPELADLLAGLPDPVTVDLIAALAARGPAYARLPDTWPGHPDAEFMRRRSLREVVADRRAARAARRAGPPPGTTLAE